MERMTFIANVCTHFRTLLKSKQECQTYFTTVMHFGETVTGLLTCNQHVVRINLSGRYLGWKLKLAPSGVTDNTDVSSWASFNLDDIYNKLSNETTLSGSVEVLLTYMKEW